MKDVALKAGVSTGTVCRALNSSPQISLATRELVKTVAESLGYRPDPLVSAFASRLRDKSKTSGITTIAYVTNFPKSDTWMSNSFYRLLFEAASERADQLGYRIEHFWLREPGMDSKRFSRILYNRGISAVFVAPTPQVRGHLSLDWDLFSSVTIGYSLLRPNLHRATVHHFHSVMTAMRELRRLGYRRVGFCLFKDTSRRVDDLWLSGILLCREKFLDGYFPYFLFDDRLVKQIPAWCQQEKLEAIIGSSEENLLHELRSCEATRDMELATLAWSEERPDISGINQRPREVAAAAVDLLIAQVERGERGIPRVPITTMIDGYWVNSGNLRRQEAKSKK